MLSLGNQLEDEAVGIAVSLRLGASVCVPITCRCSVAVTKNELHGLDCSSSKGRYPRHEELNNINHRSSVLEPCGMNRQDGRKPDGLTMFPWQRGKPLV